ncbi:hypothetical protein Tco_0798565 [Tanacetum coccineum]
MKAVRSSTYVLMFPSLSLSSQISFNSTIKLVSFEESQVVTFNGEFVCGFRNGNYGTRSQSDNTVDSPHRLDHNLRIVLKYEKKLHYLEEALPEVSPATVCNAYTRRVAKQQQVACHMLASMTLKIQKNLEDRIAFDILHELKTIFQQQANQELFEAVKAFHAYRQEEGQSISNYVLKKKGYLDQIDRLGYHMPLVLGVNLILTSLSKDYD